MSDRIELDVDQICDLIAENFDADGREVLDVDVYVEADGRVCASVELSEAEEN